LTRFARCRERGALSEPYTEIWFPDQVHDFTFVASANLLDVRGSVLIPDAVKGTPARADAISGTIPNSGLHLAFYVPLVGYTRNFSVGLLPEFRPVSG